MVPRWIVALATVALLPTLALADPVVVDGSGAVFSVFDRGGSLNPGNNGGLYLGGLEIFGGAVYVAGGNTAPGGRASSMRLIRSAGFGTATLDPGGAHPLAYTTRGADLTLQGGAFYMAATRAGVGGIYGITYGAAGETTYASGTPRWNTSGLTFGPGGTTARVTSDLGIGHYSVASGGAATLLVGQAAAPTGYGGGADDHVITKDGRVIVIGDGGRDLYDITGGAGSVALLADLDGVLGPIFGLGTRGALDPISGDIFVGMGVGGTEIYRIAADGSSVVRFATGFLSNVRDLGFGLASDGSGGTSLYATEFNLSTATGSIYEFQLTFDGTAPEPGSFALIALGLAGILLRRRKQI